MTTTVTIRKSAPVPLDQAWAAIRAIGGLDRWFPIIEARRVEGEGAGAIRIMTLAGGAGEMRDRITEIDDAAQRLRYDRFASPFPVRSYIGTVDVRAADGETEICWAVVFEAAPDAAEQVAALVEGAIGDGIAGLFADVKGSGRA